ncbi:hypothetical protein [Actinoplanes sp. NPDC089786]|uniref:hypothetical protein n=1 Tax=Actinoplanes sp. NPDC089786 TaxID=3155185 RepID=UPI00343A7FE7
MSRPIGRSPARPTRARAGPVNPDRPRNTDPSHRRPQSPDCLLRARRGRRSLRPDARSLRLCTRGLRLCTRGLRLCTRGLRLCTRGLRARGGRLWRRTRALLALGRRTDARRTPGALRRRSTPCQFRSPFRPARPGAVLAPAVTLVVPVTRRGRRHGLAPTGLPDARFRGLCLLGRW